MDFWGILKMIGGLALFLYGMDLMGDGLAKTSGGKMEKMLETMTSNKFKAVALGAIVTAVIQSSSATTVIVVGFVNSGIMKLQQAVGVIMGANIGTTMTSWLLSLTGIESGNFFVKLLKPSSFTPVLALIGVIFAQFLKKDKKKSGAIRQIGFSYHGNSEMFCKLVDAYDWDFCQIQYNYMDEHSQAGRKGLYHAHAKGIPVIIMEPLRGGKLVNRLPDTAKKIFEEYKIKRTPAQWAFRWLWNQPEVTVVLSGMNSDEMVRDNIQTASTVEVGELGEDEEQMLKEVVKAINAKMKVGCTGCGYCMPCPKGVDIPGTFAAYNRRYAEGRFWSFVEYVMCTTLRKNSTGASNCIKCGKCEKHCPQHIEIRKNLDDAKKELETPLYRMVQKAVKKFVKF